MALDLLIRAPRAIVDGAERGVMVGVRDGRIVSVDSLATDEAGAATASALPEAARVLDLEQDEVLLPGLVDSHVHVDEPGRTEWEGFASATKAASAGGVTTLVDMPLNCVPPTTTVAALRLKREIARDQSYINVGFWGGAIPGNAGDLAGLYESGVFGFKCFTLPSGVDEFPHLSPPDLETAMRETSRLDALMIVHAEDEGCINHAGEDRDQDQRSRLYRDFLRSRPRGAETLAIAQVIELARWLRARTHILHLSSADALPMIRSARAEGVDLTVETCPHYLTFVAEAIPDGATQFKCCPPIREEANQAELWAALGEGVIDIVVTDHSPCTVDLKELDVGDFSTAWGGVAGLQVGLAATWSGARTRGYTLADVVGWMSTGPADFVGLTSKGRIEVGADADFAVFAPDEEFTVKVADLHHKNPVSAYDGSTLTGVVRSTWLNGIPIDIDAAPRGELLRRGKS